MTLNKEVLLSREEAAKYLGVSKGTLEVWASAKRYGLPFIKIGRLAKYRLSDLNNFIETRNQVLTPPQKVAKNEAGQE